MYTSFKIENFRGFDHLELDDLARINLIAGKNNVGKTSLLEAIFINTGHFNYEVLRRKRSNGKNPSQLSSASLFHNLEVKKHLTIDSCIDGATGREVEISYYENINDLSDDEHFERLTKPFLAAIDFDGVELNQWRILKFLYSDGKKISAGFAIELLIFSMVNIDIEPFNIVFVASSGITFPKVSNAELYSALLLEDITANQTRLVEALRILEPRLDSITILTLGDSNVIHGQIGNQLMPLNAMGEGVERVTEMILAIGKAQNGILLIDEIENGLHYSVLEEVWKVIAKAARDFNVQIFATTHSLETIRAAHQAFSESDTYDFRYHRLDRRKSGQITASSYDQETMQAAVEMDFEIRG